MCELDAVYQALADERRRVALSSLQRHHSLALADLAELVAEQLWGRDVTAISDERIRDLYLSLYHTHVPVLERAGLAHYEQEPDLVREAPEACATLGRAQDRIGTLRGVAYG